MASGTAAARAALTAPDTIPIRGKPDLRAKTAFVVPRAGVWHVVTEMWAADRPCPHVHTVEPLTGGKLVAKLVCPVSGEVVWPPAVGVFAAVADRD